MRTADTVCLLAPLPAPEELTDGYCRRIDSIDSLLPEPFIRIYLMGDRPQFMKILAEKRDERHYYLQFNSASLFQRQQIFSLIRRSGRLYVHSVYRFVAGPVSARMLRALSLPGVKILWDVHGAVPEEIEQGGDLPIARRAADAEKALYEKSSVIICVTKTMVDHLRNKYGEPKARMLVLPILPEMGERSFVQAPPILPEKPTVVYAGGLQSWQCVGDMIALMNRTWDRYDYRIYTPDPGALTAQWGPGEGKDHVFIASAAQEEMGKAYQGCRYGLLLRNDTAVNRVAFPTKLIEYISYGIVPVLKTAAIGVIEELGLGYITAEALEKGELPSEADRRATAENNCRILQKEAETIRHRAEEIF